MKGSEKKILVFALLYAVAEILYRNVHIMITFSLHGDTRDSRERNGETVSKLLERRGQKN